MTIYDKDCFHVHTYRCGHAENIPDEAFIKGALNTGATGIWFTDHAPFPGDPFKNRMLFSELDEYIKSIKALKNKYKTKINVHIGLEIEYFPSFDESGYYESLYNNPDIELLLLGQHMAETEDGYTFSWEKERLDAEEYIALGNAEISGMNSGYFQVIAHPDRIFRRQKYWTKDMQIMTDRLIHTAREHCVLMEQNESSKRHKHHYWKEFWTNVKPAETVNGLDAHYLKDIRLSNCNQ